MDDQDVQVDYVKAAPLPRQPLNLRRDICPFLRSPSPSFLLTRLSRPIDRGPTSDVATREAHRCPSSDDISIT